jgi:hypothetical protein
VVGLFARCFDSLAKLLCSQIRQFYSDPVHHTFAFIGRNTVVFICVEENERGANLFVLADLAISILINIDCYAFELGV